MRKVCRKNSKREFGKFVLLAASTALATLSRHLGMNFDYAVQMVLDCQGAVILTGLGKSGIIAQKISATLASTGTLSYYIHPTDSLHGDLGRVQNTDLIIVLSYGGETEEVVRLVDIFTKRDLKVIGITSCESSALARRVDVPLLLGKIVEACPLGLSPTTTAVSGE